MRGIDPLIGPELLYTLASMGHSDELVVVDRNFPALSHHSRVHRLDGIDAVTAITAVLTLFPLDGFTEDPVMCMQIPETPGELNEVQRLVLKAAAEASDRELTMPSIDRMAFYEATRSAYAVLATGEDRPYGCFVLKKGVLPQFGPYAAAK